MSSRVTLLVFFLGFIPSIVNMYRSDISTCNDLGGSIDSSDGHLHYICRLDKLESLLSFNLYNQSKNFQIKAICEAEEVDGALTTEKESLNNLLSDNIYQSMICYHPANCGLKRIIQIFEWTNFSIAEINNLSILRESPTTRGYLACPTVIGSENICTTQPRNDSTEYPHYFDSYNLLDIKTNETDEKTIYALKNIMDKLVDLEIIQLKNLCLTMLLGTLLEKTRKLKTIDLSFNRLEQLDDLLFQSSASSLVELNLSHNKLTNVNENLFKYLSKLVKLDLSENQLTTISENAFRTLIQLEDLNLDSNMLTNFSNHFQTLSNLRSISLANNRLNMKSPFHRNYSVLENCTNLNYINLRNNFVTTILFDWLITLHQLKHLDLSGNNVTKFVINDDVMKPRKNKFLYPLYIFLQDNYITNVDFNINERTEEEEKISRPGRNYKFYRDVKVNLANNPIDCSSHENFNLITFVRGKPDQNSTRQDMNPLKCGHRTDLSTYDYSIQILDKNELKCGPKNDLANNTLLSDVHREEFYETRNCTHLGGECNCKCRSIDGNYVLNCKHIPKYLQENEKIELSILEISPNLTLLSDLLMCSKNVTKLSLAGTSLTTVNGLNELPLEVLQLNNNKLKYLEAHFVDKLRMLNLSVNLDDNPWRCSHLCDMDEMRLAQFVRDKNLKNVKCEGTLDDLMYKLSDNDLCNNYTVYIISLIIVAVFGLSFAAVVIFYLNFTYEIKLFLFKNNILCFFLTEEEEEEREYDAFVSYSHENADFIADHLVPNLEGSPYGYKLCLHERDWVPGPLISSQIIHSVANSRRTILILSKDSQTSTWVEMEFKIAFEQMLRDRVVRLIIVLYEDLDPNQKMFPELEAYLNTNTYLKWDNTERFWDRLRMAITHRYHLGSRNNYSNSKYNVHAESVSLM